MIRKYEKKDIGRVMEIWLAANLDAHGFIRGSYWRECLPQAAEAIAGAEVYVAEKNGVIIGFIGLCGGYIEGIFVDGGYRSQGAGKSLLDFAKGLYPKLTLCVYEKNTRAEEFYQREGFRPVRKKPDITTGETEILMKWEEKRIKFDL